MTRIVWNDDKIRQVKELIIAGETSGTIAKILNDRWELPVNKGKIDNIRCRFLIPALLEKSKDVTLYGETQLPADNYMISCDYHSPYYSELWTNRLLAIAKKYGIKKHVIAGDLFDLDFAKWQPLCEGEERGDIDKEKAYSDPLIKALTYFDAVYLLAGNHETRLGRMTDAKIQFSHIVKYYGQELGARLTFSNYDKMRIGDDWMIAHPKSYSQISGSVAVRLAEKFQRNILNAHGHFIALRFDRSGNYMGIDLGGMFDYQKIAYSNLKTTTHPFWNNGFGMLLDGHFHHFHKYSDWSALV